MSAGSAATTPDQPDGMRPETPTAVPPPARPGFRALPAITQVNIIALGAVAAALTILLWPYWRENPDLSHGFLMPAVFLFLLHESRGGYPRYLPDGRAVSVAVTVVLILGVLTLSACGLYAAALAWTHPLVAFTFSLALVLLLGAGLIALATSAVRFVPFNWASCSAVALWMLCAPIPPGSYTRLTLGLQLVVTKTVLGALHLLGIPANHHGNIIDLATTRVGVEDACSGVRSLVSCIFAGIFFSATMVRGPYRRALVVVLAAPIAIAMNFIRSLTLTLLANSGVDISGRWHDITGFTVLALTAAILACVALLLARRASPPAPLPIAPRPQPAPRIAAQTQWSVAGTLLFAAALALFFFLNTRPSTRLGAPVPDLAGILPAQIDGWRVETSTDLYQFSATLKTDHLAQRTYWRTTTRGPQQVTIYLAYWRAGQAPVSLVASHTPDACWPGSGWEVARLPQARERLLVEGRTLPDAEARKFTNGDYPQYVWFWHLYDGRPIAYRDPYSAKELLNIAWRYGFTHEGDQLFVRVSSNQPWSTLAAEPLLAQIFGRLKTLGL